MKFDQKAFLEAMGISADAAKAALDRESEERMARERIAAILGKPVKMSSADRQREDLKNTARQRQEEYNQVIDTLNPFERVAVGVAGIPLIGGLGRLAGQAAAGLGAPGIERALSAKEGAVQALTHIQTGAAAPVEEKREKERSFGPPLFASPEEQKRLFKERVESVAGAPGAPSAGTTPVEPAPEGVDPTEWQNASPRERAEFLRLLEEGF